MKHSRREHDADRRFVCGIHSVKSTLERQPQSVRRLLVVDTNLNPRLRHLTAIANRAGVKVKHVPREMLDRIARETPHQGVTVEVEPYQSRTESELQEALKNWKRPLVLALDSVQDPRNLGACLRTAECAGVNAVLIGKNRCSPITDVVQKAASGALDSLFVVQVSNLVRTLNWLKEQGSWIIGTIEQGEQTYNEIDYRESTTIVVGGEASGLRKLTREMCDALVSIPMLGSISSLNISVATGVVLFEVQRQRAEHGSSNSKSISIE